MTRITRSPARRGLCRVAAFLTGPRLLGPSLAGLRLAGLLLAGLGFAGAASAQALSLPANAQLTEQQARDPGSYDLPLAPWDADAGVRVRAIEGPVSLRAYRLDGSGLTPLQLMAPLREQVTQAGFEIVLDCAARRCGGFDFRFATEILPAPGMYVDLSAYRFLSAIGSDGAGLSILTSRDRGAGYVQIVRAGRATPPLRTDGPTPAQSHGTIQTPPGSLAEALERDGHVVLEDMVFGSGAAALADGAIASLDALADYLRANPSRRILFVGHTDAVGSLDANRALSRKRAQAAVAYLTARGIAADQIGADGVGYLAPRSTNLTPEGRKANRRVEAVLISTR